MQMKEYPIRANIEYICLFNNSPLMPKQMHIDDEDETHGANAETEHLAIFFLQFLHAYNARDMFYDGFFCCFANGIER